MPLGRNAAVLLQIFRQIDSLIAAGNFDVDTNVRTAAAGFGQVTDNGKLVTKMFDLTSGVELKEAMVNLSGSLGPKDLSTIWSTRWVQDTGRKLSYLQSFVIGLKNRRQALELLDVC